MHIEPHSACTVRIRSHTPFTSAWCLQTLGVLWILRGSRPARLLQRFPPQCDIQLPLKVRRPHSDSEINFTRTFDSSRSFVLCFMHTLRLGRKTSRTALVGAPIVFALKWHPSKLMGYNHQHKYTVTRPTARSWVFNSQSMGWKEWQAPGTQFPISLTTHAEYWRRIWESLAGFENLFGDCSGKTNYPRSQY